ncbi:MAG: ComF family protein [Bacteroidia bacterium]|nr:ComF family protein [Bacteroidia bacterium]
MKQWIREVRHVISDVVWIFYPELCVACSGALNAGESCLCTSCRLRMPRTRYHQQADNPVARHFWGKVKIEAAASCFYFSKGEKVQRLIHQLKYSGRTDAGLLAGEIFGYDLMNTSPYNTLDLVIPVPLHKSRLIKRGYNQCDSFAEGIAASMGIRCVTDGLERTSATETQTRKHRFDRHMNVENVFRVNKPAMLMHKHIFLVDDVVTTGATLTACAEALLKLPGTRVSIGALASA